jgi:hypothetical protein
MGQGTFFGCVMSWHLQQEQQLEEGSLKKDPVAAAAAKAVALVVMCYGFEKMGQRHLLLLLQFKTRSTEQIAAVQGFCG